MKIESTEFTQADVEGFLNQYHGREIHALAERLEAAAQRLEQLGARVQAASGDGDWTAHEVLAHLSVVAKFYGVMTYSIATGRLSDLDFIEQVKLRDVAGRQAADTPPAELVRRTTADLRRTAEFLRKADPASLRRRIEVGLGETLSAEDMARLPLAAHAEDHLEQLEKAL